jgi:hypothetical protein
MPANNTNSASLPLSYFYAMINAGELRLGNLLLHKYNGKISMVTCGYSHFELLGKGDTASFFPVLLKPELLSKCGFTENKDYPLAPQSREFILVLPVIGSNKNEIYGYVKNNGECFVRATVNGAIACNNFFHLHQLQNLYFSMTGQELEIKK